MINLLNWSGSNSPSILHFQGKARYSYEYLFECVIKEKTLKCDPDITILVCATHEENSPLIKQLNANSIPYINTFEKQYYHKWANTIKITSILNGLKGLNSDQIVLVLDGYDTAIYSLSDLKEKFLSTGKRILFNSTKHNYPNVFIDRYRDRDFIGNFRYFNAGCCIGYAGDLIKFYSECEELLKKEPTNPWGSEQYIVRKAWAKYSEDPNRMIDFDHDCNIFQTFGSTQLQKIDENTYKVI